MKRIFSYIIALMVAQTALAQVYQQRTCTELADLIREGWQVQHCSLSFDKQTIVFSAKEPESRQFDIYTAQKKHVGWSKPELVTSIATNNDELWPSISSDKQQIYFVRRTPADPKDKKSEERFTLMVSTLNGVSWDNGQTLVINEGHDIAPLILPDNQTLLFASKRPVEGKKELQYSLFYTRKVGQHNWYIPKLIYTSDEKGVSVYGALLEGSVDQPTLSFTKQTCSRKDTSYSIEYLPLALEFRAQPIITLTGTTKDQATQQFIGSTISIFDAITSNLLSRQTNNGSFTISLPAGRKYLLDITAPNYSHAYLQYDCESLINDSIISEYIELSKEIDIRINIYDQEMQTPIEQVQCLLDGKMNKSGTNLKLPIGGIYNIRLKKLGYADAELAIDARKEVLLSQSELDIEMLPGKAPVQITLVDATSNEPINGTVQFSNQNREEILEYAANQTRLRQGEQYSLNANAIGYLYFDSIVTIPYREELQKYIIPLRKITEELVLQLHNIQFEYNSADLLESSYSELDKVVRLLEDNPGLRIELAAHTDDHGSDKYNNALSQKRGEAARKYLLKHGISEERVNAIGYGKKQPLVPNDSDENRAINRRVEFKVIGL